MIEKLKSKIKLRIIAKLLYIFCAFCQLLFITLEYTEFKDTISIKAGYESKHSIPSISVCVLNKQQLNELNKYKLINESIEEYILRSIKIEYWYTNESNSFNKFNPPNNKINVIQTSTQFSPLCFTYFSELFNLNKLIQIKPYQIIIYCKTINTFNFSFIIHSSNTLPFHYNYNNRFIPVFNKHRYNLMRFGYNVIEENSLKYPFKSNCIDYDLYNQCFMNNILSVYKHELKSFKNISIINLELKNNTKVLNVFRNNCQKSCHNQYINFEYIYNGLLNISRLKNYNYISCYQRKSNIIYTKIPKMDSITYLCQMFGVMSLWFGIHCYLICQYFIKKILLIIYIFFTKY